MVFQGFPSSLFLSALSFSLCPLSSGLCPKSHTFTKTEVSVNEFYFVFPVGLICGFTLFSFPFVLYFI